MVSCVRVCVCVALRTDFFYLSNTHFCFLKYLLNHFNHTESSLEHIHSQKVHMCIHNLIDLIKRKCVSGAILTFVTTS